MFHVKLYLFVKHDDREKEFFAIKKLLSRFIKDTIDVFDAGSCEMIAEKILHFFKDLDVTRVEVSEDGENGAIITV